LNAGKLFFSFTFHVCGILDFSTRPPLDGDKNVPKQAENMHKTPNHITKLTVVIFLIVQAFQIKEGPYGEFSLRILINN